MLLFDAVWMYLNISCKHLNLDEVKHFDLARNQTFAIERKIKKHSQHWEECTVWTPNFGCNRSENISLLVAEMDILDATIKWGENAIDRISSENRKRSDILFVAIIIWIMSCLCSYNIWTFKSDPRTAFIMFWLKVVVKKLVGQGDIFSQSSKYSHFYNLFVCKSQFYFFTLTSNSEFPISQHNWSSWRRKKQ